MKTQPLRIKLLESRDAPAVAFHLIDVDGDLVTISTNKGQPGDLAVNTSTPSGAVAGGKQIDSIILTNPNFDGTSLTVTAKPGPLGGDGLVNVVSIVATGRDLGAVTVHGDLQDIDAGMGTPASKVASINVDSTSGISVWTLNVGSIAAINVKHDLRGAEIHIDNAGARLGAVNIGGSLVGEFGAQTGFFSVANGRIDKVLIRGNIQGGGTNPSTGVVTAKDILTATVGGNIQGGAASNSGKITVSHSLSALTVKGNVIGGTNSNSGLIHSNATLGNITIGGSLVGGTAGHSGTIEGVLGIGKVKIGRDQQGGDAADAGDIESTGGGIDGITIGGSLVGGTASSSGRVVAEGGNVGPIKIGGNLVSGQRDAGGALLTDSGMIFVQKGTFGDTDKLDIGSLIIGGSIVGYSNVSGGGLVLADGGIGVVKVGRDIRGGPAQSSGKFRVGTDMASLAVGGSIIGGAGNNSALIQVNGNLGAVTIGGSVHGGDGNVSGSLFSSGHVGNVKVGGDLVAGANSGTGSIIVLQGIGAVTIGGSLIGNSVGDVQINCYVAMKSLTIGGRVDHATISAIAADAQIGAVKVGGDWIASSLAVGVDAGADSLWGTIDDAPSGGGDPAIFSKIASITIGGKVVGTSAAGDHFGFVSQEIGSVKVNGVKVPLTNGHANDTDTTDTHLILGITRDVTIHEV